MAEWYHETEDEALKPFSLAIGVLCNEWAMLEFFVRQLFVGILRMPEDEASYTIANCIDFRDQLKAIKVAAVAHGMDREWTEELIESIDYIDNSLRSRRNRFVHDRWEANPHNGTVYRTNRTPKLTKPQARQPRTLHDQHRTVQAITELQETIDAIRGEGGVLMSLALMIDSPADYALEREQLPVLRERPLLPPLEETPDRRGYGG